MRKNPFNVVHNDLANYTACIGYGNRQRRRTGSGHGREQNRQANVQTMGETLRARAGGWMAFVKHVEPSFSMLASDVRESSASKTV